MTGMQSSDNNEQVRARHGETTAVTSSYLQYSGHYEGLKQSRGQISSLEYGIEKNSHT